MQAAQKDIDIIVHAIIFLPFSMLLGHVNNLLFIRCQRDSFSFGVYNWVMIITFVYRLPILSEIFQREIKEFISSKIFVGPYKINLGLQITIWQFILKHSILFSYYISYKVKDISFNEGLITPWGVKLKLRNSFLRQLQLKFIPKLCSRLIFKIRSLSLLTLLQNVNQVPFSNRIVQQLSREVLRKMWVALSVALQDGSLR